MNTLADGQLALPAELTIGATPDRLHAHSNVAITASNHRGRPLNHSGTGWRNDNRCAANSSFAINSSYARAVSPVTGARAGRT